MPENFHHNDAAEELSPSPEENQLPPWHGLGEATALKGSYTPTGFGYCKVFVAYLHSQRFTAHLQQRLWKTPFVRPVSSYWFVCLPLLSTDPLLLRISPTLVGKSMWHVWLLRDALSVLRWEAKPRAGSVAACLTCFTFPCIRTNW